MIAQPMMIEERNAVVKALLESFQYSFKNVLGSMIFLPFIIHVIINDNIFPMKMQQETLTGAGDKGFLFDRQTGQRKD